MGLDVNGDGVCDAWDVLDWLASTRVGRLVGTIECVLLL